MIDAAPHAARTPAQICLTLPKATEKEAWGEPTFGVGGKMFVMFSNNHHNDGRVAAWCNATFETQDLFVHADPSASSCHRTWVRAAGWACASNSAAPNGRGIAEIVEDAYRMTAPKRLARVLDRR